jgi:hypothetical protein
MTNVTVNVVLYTSDAEAWYEAERRHSSLGTLRPIEFEAPPSTPNQTSTQDEH